MRKESIRIKTTEFYKGRFSQKRMKCNLIAGKHYDVRERKSAASWKRDTWTILECWVIWGSGGISNALLKKKKSNMAWIQIAGWKIHEVIKYIVGSVLCVIEPFAFNNSEICQKKLFIKNKRSAGGTAIFFCSLAQILNCWTLQRNSSYLRGKGSFLKKGQF